MTPEPISVLDHGVVELLDSMGDDLRVVNAAQASFDRSSDSLGERELGILASLMREEHGVPFEHVVMTFRLRLPIFVARQFVKHRAGSSWSEHSGRYSRLEPCFYVPSREQVRVQVGKPMGYTYTQADPFAANFFLHDLEDANDTAWLAYEAALTRGIAREQARLMLPVNLYTTVVWTLNLRSLFNVLRLRMDSHAQYEARVYAEAMHALAEAVVPHSIRLFDQNGHPKP